VSIFISWSGPSSREVGREVKQLVSEVLGTDDVFMSDEDIAPGDKSLEEIDLALKRSTAALIIVSARTAREPWLNFEAGAMAVRLAKTSVVPILLDLDFNQLIQPLAQFQAIRYDDREKFRKTLVLLNMQRGSDRIKTETLDIVLTARWSKFQADVTQIVADSASPDDAAALPDEQDKIDEILSTLRGMSNGYQASTVRSRTGKKGAYLPADFDTKRLGYLHQRVNRIVPIEPSTPSDFEPGHSFRAVASVEALPDEFSNSLAHLAVEIGYNLIIECRNVYYEFYSSGHKSTSIEMG
jgi:hypothetical protein